MLSLSEKFCNNCSNNKFNHVYDVPSFNKSGVFKILQCSTCNLVFADVKPSDLNNCYEENYYSTAYPDYESDEQFHAKNNKLILKEIEQYFSPGKLVEIGSSFGYFMREAQANGWDCTGFEISQYSSMIAREKYQLDVRNEDILNAKLPRDTDLVVMLDTIEHLLDPSAVIKKAASILKPGGGIYIPTGNIRSLFAKACGKNWRLMTPPLHVYFYSPETLTKLLEQHGFRVLKLSHEGKYYNLGSLLQYVTGISKDKVPQIPIKVNLGDVMVAIAKYEGKK